MYILLSLNTSAFLPIAKKYVCILSREEMWYFSQDYYKSLPWLSKILFASTAILFKPEIGRF